jgi:hypothetical protein
LEFKSGRRAFEWYIENGDSRRYELKSDTMAKIMQDGGASLQYDANTLSNSTPSWASMIEALIDLERILGKHISKGEYKIMLGAIARPKKDKMRGYKSLAQYKSRVNRERHCFSKFTEALAAYDYISAFADED